jgi:hypothetical protein
MLGGKQKNINDFKGMNADNAQMGVWKEEWGD